MARSSARREERGERAAVAETTARPARRRFTRIVPTDEGHGVTTLELFFDLVFVFAITQITAFMASTSASGLPPRSGAALAAVVRLVQLLLARQPGPRRRGHPARRLHRRDGRHVRGRPRDPRGLGRRGRRHQRTVLLAVALAVVRAPTWASTSSPRPATRACAASCANSRAGRSPGVLLVVGAVLGGPAQTALWAIALVVDYIGIYVSVRTGGCRRRATSRSATG